MLELIHTSVPQGLKENTSGFCSVAWTAGMPVNLIPPLEQLCAYRALYPFGDPKYNLNPVAIAYQHIKYGGTILPVLSRIASAGLDYSGRSNKIAHQILLQKEETASPDFSPAALCRNSRTFVTEWNQPPQELPIRHIIAPKEVRIPAENWNKIAGNAAWAGIIAEHYLLNPSRAVYMEYPEGFPPETLLLLVTEITSLLTKEQELSFTFNTYFTSLPTGGACFLRFCPENSPALRSAERVASNPIIRLTEKNELTPAQENSRWGIYARTGIPPESSSDSSEQQEESLPGLAPIPEETKPLPQEKINQEEKTNDLYQNYLKARDIAQARLEQRRKKQQLLLGIAILITLAAAFIAISILLFSRNEPQEMLQNQQDSSKSHSLKQLSLSDDSSSTQETSDAVETIRIDPGDSPKEQALLQETPPQPVSSKPQTVEQPDRSGKPPKPDRKNIPKNRISVPSSRSLSRFLEQLASRISEENTFAFSCSLPPELENAEDLSLQLSAIGGNTAKKIVGNLPKYIRKVPGGVRILSTANIPRDGIYDYVPVPENFLEITVGNRQLHVAKKAGGNHDKIDSPRLTDILSFTFSHGSAKISVPFTLTGEMAASLPFGTLEKGSATRYDFVFSDPPSEPFHFIYRKSPSEERFLSFLSFRFADRDEFFQTLEKWNRFQKNRIRNKSRKFPDVEKLQQQIETLKKVISKFEKEYSAFYKDDDPITFGEILLCRDLKKAEEQITAFTSRKREYETFMTQEEKKRRRSSAKEEAPLFQETRRIFEDLNDCHPSNRNLLRNIVLCNEQKSRKLKQENQEKKLREFLQKQIPNLPISKQAKEKLKKAVGSRQQIVLFRDGANRNRELEQYFTRIWVTRTVKQGRK